MEPGSLRRLSTFLTNRPTEAFENLQITQPQ